MKIFIKDILPFQENDFLAPIRDKVDYAKVVLLSARNLLIDFDTSGFAVNCKMKLVVDKMSRLFFCKENRNFSISFPFSTYINNDGEMEIETYLGKKVDSQSISATLAILGDEQFRLNPSIIDFYIEADDIESIGLFLLEEIFQFEPSYIRYDHDIENESGRLHPLHHLDVNYSTYGTFKLGLNDEITIEYLEDVLNINTECSFISD